MKIKFKKNGGIQSIKEPVTFGIPLPQGVFLTLLPESRISRITDLLQFLYPHRIPFSAILLSNTIPGTGRSVFWASARFVFHYG
jgi:hypothetical protein